MRSESKYDLRLTNDAGWLLRGRGVASARVIVAEVHVSPSSGMRSLAIVPSALMTLQPSTIRHSRCTTSAYLTNGRIFGAVSAIMRHKSWMDTMDQHGLPHALSVEGHWSAQSGYAGMQSLLKSRADFTAVVVGNDQMALGAMAALSEHGLRIPEDVSVVGFDDIPESAYFLPSLTTVHQDFSALGEQSVEYLVSLIKQPHTPVHQRVLYPELVIRKSTGPVR